MIKFHMAAQNGRNIPKEDKIFGINNRAHKMIEEKGKNAVVNATIGALLDDDGNLMVLSCVDEVLKSLHPSEYAAYAPIGGTPKFREGAMKEAFCDFKPTRHVRAVATPGGTGAIRNTIANYSEYGDSVLTADWFWAPYGTIAGELGRSIETFPFFDENRKFNIKAFNAKVADMLDRQDRLVIIINTPAHNPTGYALTNEDWMGVKESLENQRADKKIALLIDVAYIDFAGDENEYRKFLPIVEEMPENVLPIMAYSMSKTFTMYGLRCGAMICLAPSEEIAEEFQAVCEYSSRASWSNSARIGQSIIERIYEDEKLKEKVTEERAEIRNMLLKRGQAFEEAAKEAGLVTVPFDAGFFVSIPCDNPDEVACKLEKEGIFVVPLAKGIRVSVASVSEEKCKMLPAKIKAAL